MAIHSMTGFGMAERAWEQRRQRVSLELRSVNARFLELKLRQPFGVAAEHRLRKRVEAALGRGRVELSIRVERSEAEREDALGALGVQPEQLAVALAALTKLGATAEAAQFELRSPTGIELLRFVQSGGGAGSSPAQDQREVPGFLDALVDEGVTALLRMRAAEGEALAAVLTGLYDELERQIAVVATNLKGEGDRLLEGLQMRAQALFERIENNSVERGRLEQELAILLLRGDVSEELARIASHLKQAREVLAGAAAVGQGKTLDFLCQELLREVTTIGSKISSHTGSAVVIEAKRTIERIREQVQNVE